MILNIMKKNKLLVLVALTYITMFIIMPNKGSQALANSSYYLIEMIQILPVIFVLTVTIEAWVPKEYITKNLGENSGFKGNVMALLLGSISAGPIYAAFPICKMLLKKGSNVTNIVIILSAWAVVKVPMLANEAKFLGIKFMSARWAMTVIAIFLMAHLIGKIVNRQEVINAGKDDEKGFIINDDYCIGCGICIKILPQYITLINKKAQVTEFPNVLENEKEFREIIEKCPTKAVTFNS